MMNYNSSKDLFERAQRSIPGGVNSPVRAFKSVGMVPPFIKSAKDARIKDIDGNEYIDYVGSWGPMILGHANDEVVNAVIDAAKGGMSFGAPTEREVLLAELICEIVPSVEMVRLVNSGTEGVMSALRLARAYTKRDKIIKFDGCYHGHTDSMLVKAGSGALTNGMPDSAGVPKTFAENTLCCGYNNIESVEEAFNKNNGEIAAIILEPVAANMGVVAPKSGFLEALRKICDKEGALLIFDEVITGFRLALGGAQQYFGITPDISVFGKIIGGGLPVGAYGGRNDIMKMVSPLGAVYQAGTLSGNPLATAAGLKTLTILKNRPEIYAEINAKAQKIQHSAAEISVATDIKTWTNRVGSILSIFFSNGEEVWDYNSALKSNREQFAKYFKEMLNNGIYTAPSQFEALFISAAHSERDIELTIAAMRAAFVNIGK